MNQIAFFITNKNIKLIRKTSLSQWKNKKGMFCGSFQFVVYVAAGAENSRN